MLNIWSVATTILHSALCILHFKSSVATTILHSALCILHFKKVCQTVIEN